MPHPHDDLDLAKTLQGGVQPTLLGRYRVVRELGHGGMGSVYLAEDTQLDGRRVAIKMPSALLARNKRAVADLKREATTAMQLSHPAIVTLRSFEQPPPPEGGVFLVMDYVEGQTLEDLLADKGTLPPEDVVALLKPVAEALDYAHERRVIHRDLKPANILIDQDGRAHLTDFGIAREMKDTMTRVTGRQDTSGTLPYMSPEQVNGENPTPAQDLYSFGAMLYECLAGHPPFHRGQIEHQILNKPADAGALPAGPLARQVMACLAKDANDRPGQAAALFAPSADCKSTTSRASGGREGADPGVRQSPSQGPVPDRRGSSDPNPQFADVFNDLFSNAAQPDTKPAESNWLRPKVQTTQLKLDTSTPAAPAAKPWERAPEPHAPPPAPASTPASAAQARPAKSTQPAEQESGCLAGLVVILVSVAFGTAAVFAAKQAPGWAGIGLATLVGLPYGIALHLCYGRTSKHAQAQGKKDTALGDIAFCLVAAALTGAITVHFDSIKAWGTSLIEKEPAALSPTREVTTEVADTPSPHADHPDEPIMVGATYAADLGDGVELVLTYIPSTEEIPAIRGRGFYMGSPESEEGRLDSETQHRVILSDYFLIGTTEVTQGQWMAVMGRNPSLYIGDLNRPVESVSWFDAVQFCEQLTARERIAGRLSDEWVYTLPTEAQWEWACRSESTSRYHSGNSDKNLYEVGWCNGSIDSETSPVGEMRVNAWGLYDMHGNVSEWCSDWYGDYPQGDVADPIGPAQGRSRVVRGGGYLDFPRYCRAACRLSQDPDAAHSGTGFRVVLKRLDDE